MQKIVKLLASGGALIALGCTHGRRTSPGTGKTMPDPDDCAPHVAGAELLVSISKPMVFGEIHGTKEVPAFVGALACEISKKDPVTVGIEWPNGLAESARRFLTAEDSTKERTAFLEASRRHWAGADGKSSTAMVVLLERLQRLRRAGRDIEVALFDGPYRSAEERDSDMARRLLETFREARPTGRRFLVLTGNLHARSDSPRWMAWRLRQNLDELLTLNLAYSGGTAWICNASGCGVNPLTGYHVADAPFVVLGGGLTHGFDGTYYFPALTASEPAEDR